MSKELVFDYGKCAAFVSEGEMENMKAMTLAAREQLLGGTGAGNDFLGWVDLPENYDKEEFARIKKAAEKIQGDSDVLLVIGIGGSYLGDRVPEPLLLQRRSPRRAQGAGDLFPGDEHQQLVH